MNEHHQESEIVFRGRWTGTANRYVIRPGVDARTVRDAWNEQAKRSERSRTMRTARRVILFATVFLPACVLGIIAALAAEALELDSSSYVLSGICGVVGLGLGIWAAIALESRVFPGPAVTSPSGRTADVELLQPELADWYHGQVSWHDIWQLAVGMQRMCDIARTAASPISQWVYDQEIAPVLGRLWSVEQTALREVADRVGFRLPPSFTEPTPDELEFECADGRPGDSEPVVEH